MKLIVMGYGRHGKDTVCELLRDFYSLTYTSSSHMACRIFVYRMLKELMGYKNMNECYADRGNHRQLWFELIKAYNHQDLTRLGRDIFNAKDVYCGIRNREEFLALKEAGLYNYAIWVDASKRKPPEKGGSCTITALDADFVLDNNGTLEDLKRNVLQLMQHIHDTAQQTFGPLGVWASQPQGETNATV